jgi:hypothetical protein
MQLAETLGVAAEVGGELQKQNIQRDIVQAQTDIQQGVALGDDPSTAREATFMKVKAEADWAADQKRFDETLDSEDLDSLSAEELDLRISELVTDQIGGADESDTYANQYAAFAGEYRVQRIRDHQDRIALALNEQGQANLVAATEARYDDHAATGDPFDYQSFHTDAVNLSPGGAEANDLMMTILATQAITNADPSLIDNIPDEWADGQRTFKHIPSFQSKILNARAQAQAALDARNNAAAKAAKLEAEQNEEAALNQAYLMAANGIDPTGFLSQQVENGIVGQDKARPLTGFGRGNRDDFRNEAANFQILAALQVQIASNPASVSPTDLFMAYQEGVYGPPESPEAQGKLRQQLTDLSEEKRNAERLRSDPIYQARLEEIRKVTEPSKDILGNPIPEDQALSAEIQREFRERVANGESPAEIQPQLIESYNERRKSLMETLETRSPATAIDLLGAGRLTPADVRRTFETQGWDVTEFEWMAEGTPAQQQVWSEVLKAYGI